MDASDEMKQANECADEIAEKHDARAQKRDRKIYAFVDDRAAELDRAVVNANARRERGQGAGAGTRQASAEPARGKAKPPAAHPGT